MSDSKKPMARVSVRELRDNGQLPKRVSDGSSIDEKEIAATRALLNEGRVEISPEAQVELAKMGLTKDDIIAMMLKSVGGRQ